MIGVYRLSRFYLLVVVVCASVSGFCDAASVALPAPTTHTPDVKPTVFETPSFKIDHGKELVLATRTLFETESLPKQKWLILGATRNEAYALAQVCGEHHHAYTSGQQKGGEVSAILFVRQQNARRAYDLAQAYPRALQVIIGDVTAQAPTDLEAAAAQCTHVFIGQEFPYAIWESSYQQMIQNVIAVAQKNHLHVVSLGRPYIYDGLIANNTTKNPLVITDETQLVVQPVSNQGGVLAQAESQLMNAAATKDFTLHIIRVQGTFGPAFADQLFGENFKSLVHREKNWLGQETPATFKWLATTQKPFALLYTPDLAAYILSLPLQSTPIEVTLLPGNQFNSIDEFVATLSTVAGFTVTTETYSKEMLFAGSLFNAELKRGLDIYQSFEQPIIYVPSPSLIQNGFLNTPLSQALTETLAWYKTNKVA